LPVVHCSTRCPAGLTNASPPVSQIALAASARHRFE